MPSVESAGQAQRAQRQEVERCLVVINESAGGAAAVHERIDGLRSRLQAVGWDVEVHLVGPQATQQLIEERLGARPTLLVIGGGDGSIRGALELVAGTEHVLGVIPLGTMNLFARSLGIPTALEDALTALTEGEDRRVDLGEINGCPFANTCSFGLYPELARMRERRRQHHPHWPKFLRWTVDTVVAARQVIRAWRLPEFRLRFRDRVVSYRLPTLIVTNNPVDGERVGGVLAIYMPRVRRPLSLLWLLLKAVFFGPRENDLLRTVTAPELELETSASVAVAVDGEVRAFEPPFRIRSRPGAIWVRCPPTVNEAA